MRDGVRRVTHIMEVVGMEGDTITTQELFTFKFQGETADGTLRGVFKSSGIRPYFLPRAELTAPRLVELAALDDAAFRKMFAGSPVKRTGRDRFLRNVLIAIGNATPRETELTAAARRCLDDHSPLVRAAAVWAFSRLAPARECAAERASRLADEEDPLVRAEWERSRHR